LDGALVVAGSLKPNTTTKIHGVKP